MKLFKWRDKEDPVRPADAPKPSRTLEDIRKELSARPSPQILDLGRPYESNIQFYSSLSAKIHYEDLITPISSRINSSEEVTTIFDDVFLSVDSMKFDLILCWDIFHYLSRDEIKELDARLRRCSHERTIVFSLISTRKEVPQTPAMLKIVNGCLNQEPTTDVFVSWPAYSKRELTQLLPSDSHRHGYRSRAVYVHASNPYDMDARKENLDTPRRSVRAGPRVS